MSLASANGDSLPEPQPSASANERRAGSAANGRRSQRPGPRPRLEQVGLTLLAPAPRPTTGLKRAPDARSFYHCPGVRVGRGFLSRCRGCEQRVGQLLLRVAGSLRSSSNPGHLGSGLPDRSHAQRCSVARTARKQRSLPPAPVPGHTCWSAPIP
ncbi:hypothetical protein NN561_003981 [Cricetulus griseus]